MSTPTHVHDTDRTEAFAARIANLLDAGTLALMATVGYRTGLFKALSVSGPVTATQAARAACLNERYVKTWLGPMVKHAIVEHDVAAGTYHLPREHAALLARQFTPSALAAFDAYMDLQGWILGHVDAVPAGARARQTAGERRQQSPESGRRPRRRAAAGAAA